MLPGGPLPKKSGWVLVTVSPSVRLSRITLFVGIPDVVAPDVLNFDSGVALDGRFRFALGSWLFDEGCKFLKS